MFIHLQHNVFNMHVLVYTVTHARTYSITLNTLVVSNDCLGKSESRTIVWVNQKVERLFGYIRK